MTERLKWKTFEEEWPKCGWVWISDYKTTWLAFISVESQPLDNLVWTEAKIEHPPVPKKDKHYCKNLMLNGGHYECKQIDREGLFVECSWNVQIYSVNYCPICGKKAGD